MKELKHTMYFEQFVQSQNDESVNEFLGLSKPEQYAKLDKSNVDAVNKFFSDTFLSQADNKKAAILGGVSKMTTDDKLKVLADADADGFKSKFLWFDQNNKIRYKKYDELKLSGGVAAGKSWVK